MKKKQIKLLLVDDHKVVRQGLGLMLRNQDRFLPVIDMASTATEAIRMIEEGKYDVFVYDISMPGMDGVELIEMTKQRVDNPRIIIFSMHTEVHFVKEATKAGALGYIVKDIGIEELTKAVITVYQYNKYYSNEVSQALLSRNEVKIANHNNMIEKLTTREIRVIKLLANDFSDVEICEKLNLSKRTIEGYRHKIKNKLGVKTMAGLVKFAFKNGLVE